MSKVHNILYKYRRHVSSLQQYKWNTIKIRLLRLIVNALYESNFMTILDFFISCWKNWPLSRGYYGCWGHTLLAVAIVERFKQGSMYGLSVGTKKVAIVESWPFVEVLASKYFIQWILFLLMFKMVLHQFWYVIFCS